MATLEQFFSSTLRLVRREASTCESLRPLYLILYRTYFNYAHQLCLLYSPRLFLVEPFAMPTDLCSGAQSGSITGTVEDVNGGLFPGATGRIDGPAPSDHRLSITHKLSAEYQAELDFRSSCPHTR